MGVTRVLSRRRAPIELRLDVLDVAVGTDAVAEQLLEVLLDVLLQRLPLFLVVPNSFAVRADGEQDLELLDLLAQAEDSLRDLEPGAQLVRVHRLGDEVVRPRLHPGQILLLDRKSTRLNSSHRCISYAVFCLKKKKYLIVNSNLIYLILIQDS